MSANGPTLAFSATAITDPADGQWLSAAPLNGFTPAVLTVAVQSNLRARTYAGFIVIKSNDATNSPRQLAVTLLVTKGSTPPPQSAFLSFPLKTYVPTVTPPLPPNPSTAFVNTVFDHSMLNASDIFSIYGCDKKVRAFSGQTGAVIDEQPVFGCNAAYALDTNLSPIVISNINYSGPRGPAHPNGDNMHLYYDGHPGIDYRSALKNYVYAAADGIITYPCKMVGLADSPQGTPTYPCKMQGINDSKGAAPYHVLEIDPANGYRIYYLHLATYITDPPQMVTDPNPAPGCPNPVTLPIPEGQSVRAGCLIALSGTAGTTTAHLHFEVQRVLPQNNVSNTFGARNNARCKDKPGFVCLPVDPYGWSGDTQQCKNGSPDQGDPYECITGIPNRSPLWR